MGWKVEWRKEKRAQQNLDDRLNDPGPKGTLGKDGEKLVSWTPQRGLSWHL